MSKTIKIHNDDDGKVVVGIIGVVVVVVVGTELLTSNFQNDELSILGEIGLHKSVDKATPRKSNEICDLSKNS